jgi:hypothetical protein
MGFILNHWLHLGFAYLDRVDPEKALRLDEKLEARGWLGS